MSHSHTKHLSFLFLVDTSFMPNVKVITQYTINVRYTLDWAGRVTLDDYNVKPGMAKHIIGWDRLEAEMLKAAENNSQQYRRPGDYRGGRVRPEGVDAYNDIHDQWKYEAQERKNW